MPRWALARLLPFFEDPKAREARKNRQGDVFETPRKHGLVQKPGRANRAPKFRRCKHRHFRAAGRLSKWAKVELRAILEHSGKFSPDNTLYLDSNTRSSRVKEELSKFIVRTKA